MSLLSEISLERHWETHKSVIFIINGLPHRQPSSASPCQQRSRFWWRGQSRQVLLSPWGDRSAPPPAGPCGTASTSALPPPGSPSPVGTEYYANLSENSATDSHHSTPTFLISKEKLLKCTRPSISWVSAPLQPSLHQRVVIQGKCVLFEWSRSITALR